MAISNSLLIKEMKSSNAAQIFQSFLISLITLLRALGCLRLINVHVVPPVHGRLSHIKTSFDLGNWFTLRAMFLRLSSDNRLFSSVNWYTKQSLDFGREQSLSFEFFGQHTSTIKRLGFGPTAGSPEHSSDAAGNACDTWDLLWGSGLKVLPPFCRHCVPVYVLQTSTSQR